MNNDYEDELERARARRRPRELTSMNEPGAISRSRQTESRRESSRMEAGRRESSRSAAGRQEAPRSRGKNISRNPGTRTSAAAVSGGGSNRKPSGKNGRSGMSRIKKFIILAVAECLTLAGIFTYAHAAKLWNSVQRPDFKLNNVENKELDVQTVEKMKGYWTIAVFGVDSRGSNVGKGTNADVNMICNINQDTGEIKLVSVFRDSYLNINDKNHYNKLNMAYADGGPEQAVKALNKNLDLNITDYATFNWKAVADGINILGGIDMEISKAEFYYINGFITETVKATGVGSHQLTKAGMNHLDGVQAVAYGRLRLMDTDFARTERQRKVIEKAFEKAKNSNFSVINNVMEVVFPQIATSLNFSDLTNMGLNVTKYHIGETGGFPSARADANLGKKGSCVIPATLEKNVTLLHQFLFADEAYTPTSAVKTISAKISSDTGVYKEGQVVNHVSTDDGYLPKATKAPETKETKEEKNDKDDKKASSSNSGRATPGSANKKTPTESTTAARPGGDASGWETWPTDTNGNPVDPALSNKKPGETSNPKESTTAPGSTGATGSTGGPGVTTAPAESSAASASPGGTVQTPGGSSQSPGGSGSGTAATTAPSLGGPLSESNSQGPGSGENTGVIIGAPGN